MANIKNFWKKCKENKEFKPVTDKKIKKVEDKFKIKLPVLLIELFKQQNGGYTEFTSCHDLKSGNLCDVFEGSMVEPLDEFETMYQFGTETSSGIDEEDWNIVLKNTDKLICFARHGWDWWVCLDYRDIDNNEPAVIVLNTTQEPEEELRVPNFKTFLEGLVTRDEADTIFGEEEEEEEDYDKKEEKKRLKQIIKKESMNPNFSPIKPVHKIVKQIKKEWAKRGLSEKLYGFTLESMLSQYWYFDFLFRGLAMFVIKIGQTHATEYYQEAKELIKACGQLNPQKASFIKKMKKMEKILKQIEKEESTGLNFSPIKPVYKIVEEIKKEWVKKGLAKKLFGFPIENHLSLKGNWSHYVFKILSTLVTRIGYVHATEYYREAKELIKACRQLNPQKASFVKKMEKMEKIYKMIDLEDTPKSKKK